MSDSQDRPNVPESEDPPAQTPAESVLTGEDVVLDPNADPTLTADIVGLASKLAAGEGGSDQGEQGSEQNANQGQSETQNAGPEQEKSQDLTQEQGQEQAHSAGQDDSAETPGSVGDNSADSESDAAAANGTAPTEEPTETPAETDAETEGTSKESVEEPAAEPSGKAEAAPESADISAAVGETAPQAEPPVDDTAIVRRSLLHPHPVSQTGQTKPADGTTPEAAETRKFAVSEAGPAAAAGIVPDAGAANNTEASAAHPTAESNADGTQPPIAETLARMAAEAALEASQATAAAQAEIPAPNPNAPAASPFPSRLARATTNVADSTLMAGATVLPEVRSRTGMHWLSAILTIVLTPICWWLLADSMQQLESTAITSLLGTDAYNWLGIGELIGGLVVLAGIFALAAASSLGPILAGALVTICGLSFIVAPTYMNSLLTPALSAISGTSFGESVATNLANTAFNGLLLIAGAAELGLGIMVAIARRTGRSEEATRREVFASNPQGLKARWAKKATAVQRRKEASRNEVRDADKFFSETRGRRSKRKSKKQR